ncbi:MULTISPECIES: glycerophosphodiester phosphodiesterase [Actinomadura]|uniref:Glycerophosphodiester phosphodiesterase n=1 Tax=Actinomadura litoris TaxID=2678616 RepID=A0A7K1KZG9_9ACTN|nr:MULTISPECIES: glycerophosphodiester phosphodiesterase [Actinomadura]MBT2211915.1 glycerophosphodiester phosphodiesterase [Actinomadura sp. NEAU-AAG7]MUN37591.1 glycerophosphodiester phosphodiesterase [Actinomadura litoris]
MRRPYAFLDHPGPIPFAHRGGAGGRPENSMAAFQRAADLGYRYFETDAHATADGVVVAFHDRTLDRVTGHTGAIARLPYAEVAKARIGGTEPIPRLEEILGSFPDARVNIDLKDAPVIGPLAEVLHRTAAWDRVCITSFSTRRLAQMRARLPLFTDRDVCTALGPRGLMALRARSYGGPAAKLVRLAATGVACAQVPYGLGPVPFVTEAFVEHAHQLGLKVHAWTVNDPAAMERLLDLGVDGIMTDELVTLRHVMAARGLWPHAAPRDD